MEFTKIENGLISETIYKGTHKSGLRVFVMPKKGFSKSYAIFGTNYGSINQQFVAPGDENLTVVPDGIAHFLEHKLFEEPDGSNVFDKFSKYGADANAFTSFVMTAYLFSATGNFYENLEVLLGYTQRPYFTDENVAKEQGIIGQEIKMYDDDASWRVYFNTLRALYKNHTSRIDIAGTVESISKIDKEVLYKCYNTFYHPSNMVLFTIGDVDYKKVGDMVDALILKDDNPGEIRQVFPDEPEAVNQKVIKQKLSVSMPQFVIAFKERELGVSGDELLRRDAVTSILLEIIAGKSSAFYNNLYEQGLINPAFYTAYEGEVSFGFSAFGGESNQPEKVQELLYAEMERMKREGIDQDAFRRQKKVNYGRMLRLLDREESFANQYIGFALKNADLLNMPEIINSISYDEITRRLHEHLDTNYSVISIVNPE